MLALLTACVPLPAVTSQNREMATAGKFLHQINVITNRVTLQMNWPNVDSCRLALIGGRRTWKDWAKQELGQSTSQHDLDELAEKVLTCSTEDKSQTLPYRVTLRAKADGLLLDIYAISLEQCRYSLGDVSQNVEVVAECEKY
jgi:hypothetical protein